MRRGIRNPFTPTFGKMPYAFVGRDELVDDVIEGLANGPGDPNRSTIFIGPRGSGKTALLRTIAKEATQQGWVCVDLRARQDLLERLRALSHVKSSHLIPTATKSKIPSVKVGPVALSRATAKEDIPWWLDLRYLVEDLNEQGVGLLIAVDEVDPLCEPLIDLIGTYQDLVSEDRDVALLMAGLPAQVYRLFQDKHVSFIRRAFQRRLEPVSRYEIEEALVETFRSVGIRMSDAVLEAAVDATGGFALAIQLVGYYLWRVLDGQEAVEMSDVEAAIQRANRELVNAVVAPTVEELTAREQEYLAAMAVDDGPSNTSDIAQRMGISMTNASNLRRILVRLGVIKSVRMGVVDYDIPLMRAFLRG